MSLKNELNFVVKELEGLNKLVDVFRLQENIDSFKKRLNDDEFRIAVVGEFSSGKSTFINALIGKDILNHSIRETTAVITNIVNVSNDDKRNGTAVVTMHNGEKIKLNSFENLKDYTTTFSEKYNVIKDVKIVEIFVSLINTKRKLVIMDTPGLNGMADGHREQTLSIIQKAHACVYLLQKHGLADSDVDFIKYILQYQKNFIFVQNFIDEFRVEEGEYLDQKLAEQTKILEEKVFVDEEHSTYSICGVSALLELASLDLSIKRVYNDSKSDLTRETRIDYHNKSNFCSFTKIMQDRFNDNTLDAIQFEDTAWALKEWLHSLLGEITRKENHAQDVLNSKKEYGKYKKLDILQQRVLDSRERYKKNLENFIIASCIELFRENKNALKAQITDLKNRFVTEIESYPNIDVIKIEQKKKSLNWEVRNASSVLVESNRQVLQQHLQALYHLLLSRIEEYSGINSEKLSVGDFSLDTTIEFDSAEHMESFVKQLKRQLDIQKGYFSSANKEYLSKSRDYNLENSNYRDIEQRIKDNKDDYDRRLSNLGHRPEVKERIEYRTIRRKRRGWGSSVTNFLFGDKEDIVEVKVTDDSAAINWDNKKENIIINYDKERKELFQQLYRTRERLDRMEKDRIQAQRKVALYRDAISNLEDKIEAKEREKKILLENSKREYIQKLKKELISQIEIYLLTGQKSVYELYKKSIDSTLPCTSEQLIQLSNRLYDEAVEQKLLWIKKSREDSLPELQSEIQGLTNLRSEVKKLYERLEQILC